MSEGSAKLKATAGAGAAALLLVYVPAFEGVVLRGYRDPIGVVTACAGHTATAVLGRPYTREECQSLLVDDLAEHAEDTAECVADSVWWGLTPYEKAAFISFTYNVGSGAFCRSTMAQKLNADDVAGACAELSRWVYAGGRQLPGLVKRRATERALCEGRLE